MKHLTRTIVFLVCTLAMAASIAADLKIGYVNAARLLEEAPQANNATQRLKKEFAPREENILSLQKELNDMEEQLRRNAEVMTENDARRLERDIVAQKRDLRRIQDEFREDLNFRRNEELGKLQELVKQVIEQVGKDDKFDLILYEGIAYASDKIDLTDDILKRLSSEANGK